MLGNTLYSTVRTWPALQFSVGDEGWRLWRAYVVRGRLMFLGAVAVFVLGAWSAIKQL
jgi:hypothetical protein